MTGDISVNNMKLISNSEPDNPDVNETLKSLYEFTTGLEGWKQDKGYTSTDVGNIVTHDTDKLKMDVDYSSVSEKEWQNASIYFSNSNGAKLSFAKYNHLSFDLYYEDSKKLKETL